MSHSPRCRTRVERFGLITVHYSDPDMHCRDASHDEDFNPSKENQ